MSSLRRIELLFAIVVGAGALVLMAQLSSILVPLVLAIFLALLLSPVADRMSRWGMPAAVIVVVLSLFTLLVIGGFAYAAYDTGSRLYADWENLLADLEAKVQMLLDWLNGLLNLSLSIDSVRGLLQDSLEGDWLTDAALDFFSGLGSFGGSFVLFALYLVAMLAGITQMGRFLEYVGGTDTKNSFSEQMLYLRESIVQYIWLKLLVSLLTGILFVVIATVFGLEYAFFWGIAAMALNFIPTIGSILGTVPPILFALIQFDFVPWFVMAVLLITVQFFIGNVLEPVIMGVRLRLNTVTVIFGLVFWGYVWGPVGMFLSVPLTLAVKALLERNEVSAPFGRLLGYPVRPPRRKRQWWRGRSAAAAERRAHQNIEDAKGN